MDEIQLTSYDYRQIAHLAQRYFLDDSPRRGGNYEGFLCYCHIKAFMSYIISQGWELRSDAKIYKKTESQK